MPHKKPFSRETIRCPHYRWKLYLRNGVYWADGRSNTPNLGRLSLGVTSREEALTELSKLDLHMAVKHGRIPETPTVVPATQQLSVDAGIEIYLKYAGRSPVLGGAEQATIKRYTRILMNFKDFLVKKNVLTWNEVTTQIGLDYAAELDRLGRASATIALELTTVKQTFKYLVETENLPPKLRLKIRVVKPKETTRYCWREEEVAAMIDYCEGHPQLHWLKAIIIGLACTGLRITELLELRWSDIKLDKGMICLTDERAHKPTSRKRRTIKNHSSRTFPIHSDIRTMLQGLVRTNRDLVFLSPDGDPLEYHYVRNKIFDLVIEPLKERFPAIDGEVGFANGQLHSFRHYFCSSCANAGVPENALMRWLGHKDSAMVKHYYHLHDDEAQRQMNTVQFLKIREQ